MAEPTSIRRASAEDEDMLTEQWQNLLEEQATQEERFTPAEDAADRWRNDFPEWLRDESYRLFVAERQERFTGFIAARRYSPPPIYAGVTEVYIDELYVAPAARGQGAGRRLVEAVRTWATSLGAQQLRLGVLAANAGARAFWEKQEAVPLSITLTIELETPAATRESAAGRIGF